MIEYKNVGATFATQVNFTPKLLQLPLEFTSEVTNHLLISAADPLPNAADLSILL